MNREERKQLAKNGGTFKALILHDSYSTSACIASVKKEEDSKWLKKYRQPDLLYKTLDIMLECRTTDLNISLNFILGDYSEDWLGFTTAYESSVYLISDEEAERIIADYNKRRLEKIQVEKQKETDKLNRAKQRREEIINKSITTGERQVLSTRLVGCNDKNEDCSMDCITEYIYPDGHIEEKRRHCY